MRAIGWVGVIWVCSAHNLVLAGTLVSISPGNPVDRSVDLAPSLNTHDPNNDNVSLFSDNWIEYELTFSSFGPIDVQINVTNAGGVSEYEWLVAMTNETGHTATGVLLKIGYGIAGQFWMSDFADGLDFDAPDFDSPPSTSAVGFGIVPQWREKEILYSGGSWFTPNRFFFSFFMDVPDDSLVPENAKTDDGYIFTIRHILLPEPTTLCLLMGLGLTALNIRPSRRHPLH